MFVIIVGNSYCLILKPIKECFSVNELDSIIYWIKFPDNKKKRVSNVNKFLLFYGWFNPIVYRTLVKKCIDKINY